MSEARKYLASAEPRVETTPPTEQLRRIPFSALLNEIDRQRKNYGPRNPAAMLLGDCKLALLDLARQLVAHEVARRGLTAQLAAYDAEMAASIREGQASDPTARNRVVDAVRALCQPDLEIARPRARQLTITPVSDDE
jgi:hypothetical protein